MGALPLTSLERDVLLRSLEAPLPQVAALRRQLEHVSVTEREESGVGMFVHLEVPEGVLDPSIEGASFQFGDVVADIPGLRYGIGFVVFVRGGRLDMLEGYTFGDERWPSGLSTYTLRRG